MHCTNRLGNSGKNRFHLATARARLTGLCRTLFCWLTLLGWGLAGSAWGSGTLVNEPMTGSSALGWVIGGAAFLTGSSGVDPAGSGWLRLTDTGNNQAGYAFFDSSFDISQGVVIQFDYVTWGGSGADGYSIFLFDGAVSQASFSAGATGGSLGYAQKAGTGATDHAGLTGGYLGVGIDEFGNFSAASEGRVGGSGFQANEVGLRGPAATSYAWLGGSGNYIAGTLGQSLWYSQAYRPDQFSSQYRKVVIRMIPIAQPNAHKLQVDVYLQFGYNQPLTLVSGGNYIDQTPPASVKVGYAASTGGSTNYHEIRNLMIDPLSTDVNLSIAKSASVDTVGQGGALSYTVTARNYGPNNVSAVNIPISDPKPALLNTYNWNCAYSGPAGGNTTPTSGSGNLSTTATMPFNGAVTCTIAASVLGTAPLGSQIVNTASLTAPTNDYNANDNSASATVQVTGSNVTVTGMVYNDANHNGIRDAGEGTTNLTGNYAKIFLSSDLATARQKVTISNTGTFSFTVPSNATYTVIISSVNDTNFNPSIVNANWVYTSPTNYTVSDLLVGSSGISNLNFGVYNGTRINGRIFRDDGSNGSISTANDGVQNASEAGLAGVSVQLVRDSNPNTIYDGPVVTDSAGNFALFTNIASRALRVVELANPAGYLSVSYNGGTSAGATFNIAGDYIALPNYTQYADISGIRFGDVPDNTFLPTPRAQNGTALNPVYFAHSFTPGSGGSVSFAQNSRTPHVPAWPAVAYYLDADCSGTYQATNPLISGAITTKAGVPVCILVQENILPGAAVPSTDTVVTRASFSFTNSVGPVAKTYDVSDTTTVIGTSDLSTSTKTWTDPNGGDQNPGDLLRYTITLKETSGFAASGASLTDNIPANLTGFSVVSYPAGATNSSTGAGTGANGNGYLNITNIAVPAGGTATVVFTATIAGGTAVGTKINNSATIINVSGVGGTALAPTVTVSASQIPANGNKSLYFYDDTSTPAYKLSRIQIPTNPVPNTVSLGAGSAQTWTLSPVLQAAETLAPAINANVPISLYLSRSVAGNVTLALACSSGGTSIASSTLSVGTAVSAVGFNLSLNGVNQTCAQGGAWQLTVTNSAGGTLSVYPVSGTSRSVIRLPSLNVINVDSVGYYSAAYPAVTQPPFFSPGSTVYLRATASDPFGSFDITSATITIKDPTGATVVSNAAMTQVYDSGAATKTYQYAFTTLPAAGPGGSWTFSVTTQEGLVSEIFLPPSASKVGTFPVALMPSITLAKSVQTISDPVNNTTSPRNIPGAVMLYTILAQNSGLGPTDPGSIIISDTIPANTAMYVSSASGDPVGFSCSTTPACGLTFNYATAVAYSCSSTPCPQMDAGGYGTNVTGVSITPGGALNGGGAQFILTLKMKIK